VYAIRAVSGGRPSREIRERRPRHRPHYVRDYIPEVDTDVDDETREHGWHQPTPQYRRSQSRWSE